MLWTSTEPVQIGNRWIPSTGWTSNSKYTIFFFFFTAFLLIVVPQNQLSPKQWTQQNSLNLFWGAQRHHRGPLQLRCFSATLKEEWKPAGVTFFCHIIVFLPLCGPGCQFALCALLTKKINGKKWWQLKRRKITIEFGRLNVIWERKQEITALWGKNTLRDYLLKAPLVNELISIWAAKKHAENLTSQAEVSDCWRSFLKGGSLSRMGGNKSKTLFNVLKKLCGLKHSLTVCKDPPDLFFFLLLKVSHLPPMPSNPPQYLFTSLCHRRRDPLRSYSHYVCPCSFLCRLVPALCRKCQRVLT